jgi:3-methylfumaryl-CoA hydratase
MGEGVRAGEDWATWIGRTTTDKVVLDPGQANRMAVTLDRAPDLDVGEPLPPGWHWLYFHDLIETSRLGEDGHPARGVTMPPVPLRRRMWAAGELAFHRSVRLGETVTRRSTIVDIVPKEGRSGRLFFVTVEHDLFVDRMVAVHESQVIVYKDSARSPVASSERPSAAPAPEFGRSWCFGPTSLFRYSALTFNGHRIHYDVDYARDVEGYPDLVVHGPLLATLLMQIAHEHGPADLARFSYQARSPLFVSRAFDVGGRHGDTGTQLWATATDGSIAMAASATYHQETAR